MNPELIGMRCNDGMLPIHHASLYKGYGKELMGECQYKVINYLLTKDPKGGSRVSNRSEVAYHFNLPQGSLPLHFACSQPHVLVMVKALYDNYPEAIFSVDNKGCVFLETQHIHAMKTKDHAVMITPDMTNGWLPLHHALAKVDISIGTIKLLIRGNPCAVRVADHQLAFPLHIACKYATVDVVKYILQQYDYCLNACDKYNDSLLHYACRGGNYQTIKFLLQVNTSLVSKRNMGQQLPIHLLVCESNSNRQSLEHVETVWLLLLAFPEILSTL